MVEKKKKTETVDENYKKEEKKFWRIVGKCSRVNSTQEISYFNIRKVPFQMLQ